MNIIHLICSLLTGGTELMLLDIARCQADMGHNVSIVIVNDLYEQELVDSIDKKINVRFIRRPEGSHNPLYLLRLYICVKRLRPDVIHLHNEQAAKVAPLFKWTICVGTVHCPDMDLHNYKKLDHIYSISQAVADDIKTRQGISSDVILNGINFDDIKSNPLSYSSSDIFRIVQTGRLDCSIKGQDIMAQAVAILSKGGRDVSVDFIGEPYDEKKIEELSARLGVSDRIHILGRKNRKKIYDSLCTYHLGAMPSRYEGFGLTLVEAMAAKIPVVATNVDGPAEILMNNRYGLLCKPEDPEDLAHAIASIMDNYPQFSANAQGPAYDYARNNFSIDTTAAHYIQAYKQLLDNKR